MEQEYSLYFHSDLDVRNLMNVRNLRGIIFDTLRVVDKDLVKDEKIDMYHHSRYDMGIFQTEAAIGLALRQYYEIDINMRVEFKLKWHDLACFGAGTRRSSVIGATDKMNPDHEAGITSILRVVLPIIELTTGDAAFFDDDDIFTPLILRRYGKLSLIKYFNFWTSERLSLVKMEYKLV